jgi:hypothetical protein
MTVSTIPARKRRRADPKACPLGWACRRMAREQATTQPLSKRRCRWRKTAGARSWPPNELPAITPQPRSVPPQASPGAGTAVLQGLRTISPHPLLRFGQVSLDEGEHFLHNREASVATLRWCSESSRHTVRLRRNPQVTTLDDWRRRERVRPKRERHRR